MRRGWTETRPCAACGAAFESTRSNHLYCSRGCQPCRNVTGPGHFTVHGHAKGRRHSPTYRCWSGIIQRCENPNNTHFRNYGARGIRVCDRWKTFANFLSDMGERPDGLTIDRIDNRRGYEPGNCRWASRANQQQNTRITKLTPSSIREIRRKIAAGMTQRSVAAEYGVSKSRIHDVVHGRSWSNIQGDE